ncbi:DUF3795 domain-containing protein [Candidatus Woesearchaeota archaeon]|nr:DUF3795 domain-containing protein [Candidatus Woesearchaeota archaeon]
MKHIACCGLDCYECPAYIATQEDSDAKRKVTAELWTEEFKTEIKPGDVNCDGCRSNGERFSHCNVCEIRKCVYEKNLKNCAFCTDYACAKLNDFFIMAPEAKSNLENIRK